ncbi:MAG: hypothetical protein QGG40_09250 [Myxococcota bacterium]|nr:hypothetical protein [Myxococcota bacterium]
MDVFFQVISVVWALVWLAGLIGVIIAPPGKQFLVPFAGLAVSVLAVMASFGLFSEPPVCDAVFTLAGEPVAENAEVALATSVSINGKASYDPDHNPLEYRWELVHKPEESQVELKKARDAVAALSADVEGLYTVQMFANDGSEECNVQVGINAIEPVPAKCRRFCDSASKAHWWNEEEADEGEERPEAGDMEETYAEAWATCEEEAKKERAEPLEHGCKYQTHKQCREDCHEDSFVMIA